MSNIETTWRTYDAPKGVRPGVKSYDWMCEPHFMDCLVHHRQVSSIDPNFHLCADCGHSWKDSEPQGKELPRVECATCAYQTMLAPPLDPVEMWVCTLCGVYVCPDHTQWSGPESHEDTVPLCYWCKCEHSRREKGGAA